MRRLLLLTACIWILISCSFSVSAHPGGTDGSGGHTDRSTGEYHYHHGYPAHDHYDMDGDGNVDCPYDFHDKTVRNSSASSAGYQTDVIIQEVPFVPVWVKWLLGILSASSVCLFFGNRWKKQGIAELQKEIEQQADRIRQQEQSHREELRKKEDAYFSRLKEQRSRDEQHLQKVMRDNQLTIDLLQAELEDLRCELHSVITTIPAGESYYPEASDPELALYRIEIPEDVYFIEGNIPVKGIVTSYAPFGDFTVFTLKNSLIYHSNKYCSGTFNADPAHLFDVMSSKRPCLRCGKNQGPTPPQWYLDLTDLQKYYK